MGTHPIFESDFDCLTEFCRFMAHEFTVREESEKSEITGMKFCSKRFGCKQDCAKSKNLKFGSPIEVGCYSVDGEREFRHDGSELAYLYLPKENKCGRFFDLSRGYEDKKNVKKPNRLFTGIYHLLTWARLNLDKVFGPDSADPTFFGYRHIFTKIMCSPYDCKTAWNLLAIKLNDTIFLAEYRTVAQHEQNENLPHYVKKCQFWVRVGKPKCALLLEFPESPQVQKSRLTSFGNFAQSSERNWAPLSSCSVAKLIPSTQSLPPPARRAMSKSRPSARSRTSGPGRIFDATNCTSGGRSL